MLRSKSSAPAARRRHAALQAATEPLESRTLFSTYYVDVAAGADTNPGVALDAPFKSITRAAQIAQPGDTVLIRAGTYRETLAPAHSGSVDNPITFKPYNNEQVTLTGLDALDPATTDWTLDSGNVYKAHVALNLGDQNQIFLDGRPLVEARWPNLPYPTSGQPDYLDLKNYASAKSATSRTSGSIAPASAAGLPQGADLNGAHLMINGGSRYADQTGSITSAVGKGGSVSFKNIDPFSYLLPRKGSKYYLSAKRVLLDAPGEWFYDPSTQTLYVYTPAGDSPANHTIEVKARTAAIDLSDHDDITAQGFNVVAGSLLTNSESDRDTFDSITSTWGAYTAVIPFGTFDNSANNPQAVRLDGSENTLSNSTIAYATGDGVTLLGFQNNVVNNTIHDVDLNATYAAGVTVIGQGYLVYHNSIYNVGRDGIRVRGFPEMPATGAPETPKAVRAGRIAYNDVHDYGLVSHDCAAIDANGDAEGGGTSIDHNWLHDNRTDTSVGFRGTGVYLDNGADRFTITHNVMWNNGDSALWLNASDGGSKNRFGQSVGNVVTNNTDAGGHRRGFVINGERLHGKTQIDAFGTRFANNVSTAPPAPVYLSTAKFVPGHAAQIDHNVKAAVANKSARNFSAPAALGKGVNIPGLMDDDGGNDAGAYEAGQSWTPGATPARVNPADPIPGAGRTDLQTVVDNLTDLSRTFSAPGFIVESGPFINGFETGTAHRGSAANPSVIYRYDDIQDFAVKYFGAPATIQFSASTDGVTFTPVQVTNSSVKKGGYTTARPAANALPADTNYLRIDLNADSTRLAQAEFTYRSTDLALAHAATANQFDYTTGDFRADNAVDLNPATLWKSLPASTPFFTAPQLTLDLGSPQPISQLRLDLLKQNGASPQTYTIETSDDLEHWSTLYDVTNGAAAQGTATVASNSASDRTRVDLTGQSATARFVHITADTTTTFGLWDFQVYNA